MVAQISRPVAVLPRPIVAMTRRSLQVFVAPQRSLYADVLANAIRTAGQGAPVLVVQLFEGGSKAGVAHPIQLCQHLAWLRCQTDRYLLAEDVVLTAAESASIGELWAVIREGIRSGAYRLVVIEGLSLAIKRGLIPEQEAVELLAHPHNVDVVLTGQEMLSSLLELADQITKFRS